MSEGQGISKFKWKRISELRRERNKKYIYIYIYFRSTARGSRLELQGVWRWEGKKISKHAGQVWRAAGGGKSFFNYY
jgi:hypothetical protein